MSVRKSVLLRQIVSYIATPLQLQEFDLIASRNKGSSTHFAHRLILRYFEKKSSRENERYIRENVEKKPKTSGIRVNSRFGSYVI